MSEVALYYGAVQIGVAPRGWGNVKVDGNLVEVLGGFSCARTQTVSSGVAHLRPMNISTSGEVVMTADTQYVRPDYRPDLANYHLQPGDILFNNTNSVELVGKTAVVREPMAVAFSNHINRLRVRDVSRIEPRWLALALRNLQEQGVFAAHCNRWIGQAGFSVSGLAIMDIPIPYPDDPARSLAEQRRIVARLEALLGEVRELRKLQAEIEADVGRLMEAAIRDVFDQPNDTWRTSPILDVALIQTGTAKGRHFGSRRTVELPYLRVANVQAGALDLDEVKTIAIAEDEIDRYRLQPGDLLLTEGGDHDKLGRGAVWDGQIEPCVHQNHIFAVRFDANTVLPRFAEYEMQSWHARSYFLGVAKKTTNLATINRTKLGDFPLLYPTLPEQCRIVARLDAAKANIMQMIEAQSADCAMIDQLEQSILAQAFRGEL